MPKVHHKSDNCVYVCLMLIRLFLCVPTEQPPSVSSATLINNAGTLGDLSKVNDLIRTLYHASCLLIKHDRLLAIMSGLQRPG